MTIEVVKESKVTMMTDDKITQQPDQPENVGDNPATEIPAEDALAAAQQENAALKDQLLRALAETENVRRRAARDKEDAAKFAMAGFAREILGVADNLRRALEAITPEALEQDAALKNLYDGILATERQLDAAFEKQAIKKVWPLGEKFDSNLHQAMFEVPGTDQPSGTVVQVLQAGYTLNDRLLRPAMVGVAKGQPAAPAGNGGTDETGDGRVNTVV
ncbi:nucleotide exchange factor GrpE [Dongia soli]|uniref:Protein GrpE n=1 Tax=Dongia soli TaxID=600628 RepID=A0ABU5E6V1_9PROT|nr:nucleotide exchange factor GrpE [Dongia soli]MDY0881906.1 nucleotide exchange factor GrpE [Dongia soli]